MVMTSNQPQTTPSDWQGINQLLGDGITGVTDLVEAMHQRVASLGGVLNRGDLNRTTGLSGFIYRRIRQTTRWVNGAAHWALSAAAPWLPQQADHTQRLQWLSILNGLMGDHLHATDNPLALKMGWHHNQQATTAQAAAEYMTTTVNQPLLLIHGLCMNDRLWHRQGHDHGLSLQQELPLTSFYLRYNSGLAVTDNGRQLAAQLKRFFHHLPSNKRLKVLVHSMGGLVLRSAIHVAEQAGDDWPQRLGQVLFLGTPHQGAALEQAGHLIDYLLTINPYAAPFAKLGQVRSLGIKNLRLGSITAEHQTIQLPQYLTAHALAGRLPNDQQGQRPAWLGDGLVAVDSALGRHQRANLTIDFPPARQQTFDSVSHMGLLSDNRVYQAIKHIMSNDLS